DGDHALGGYGASPFALRAHPLTRPAPRATTAARASRFKLFLATLCPTVLPATRFVPIVVPSEVVLSRVVLQRGRQAGLTPRRSIGGQSCKVRAVSAFPWGDVVGGRGLSVV